MRRFMVWATVTAWLLQTSMKSHADVVVNVQFGKSGTGNTLEQTGAAMVGSAGDKWNLITSFPGSGAVSLLNTAGAASGIGLTSSGFAGTFYYASANYTTYWNTSPVRNLMSSYYNNNSASSVTTFSFSGLDASKVYDIYVYTQPVLANLKLSVSLNGGTAVTSANSVLDTNEQFVLNQNYLLLSNKSTTAGGVFNLGFSNGGGTGGNFGCVNGIQIVAVPEPGTLLLGGIAAACGGTGVWWKRRKKAPADQPAEEPTA
jgi:hypothetical protein